MGERSLGEVAYVAFVKHREANGSSGLLEWSELATARAWEAAGTACAQQEREATEAQRFLVQKFEARCTELEATVESGRSMNAVLRTQLADAQAQLRAQVRCARALEVSDDQREQQVTAPANEREALRAQLAEAKDEAATLRGQLALAQERNTYLEKYTAELSDALTRMRAECATARDACDKWAHKCGEAQAEARELREGRATWVTDDDETRRLVLRSVVETEVGCVGPTLSEKASWQVEYGSVQAEGMCCIEPGRDFEQAMCRAQRIVEAVAGVRP